MPQYPLIFSFSKLFGTHYRALVQGDCRLLAELVDGEWWCRGVEPGSLFASGRTLQEATDRYRARLTEVLSDFVEQNDQYAGFKRDVTGMLGVNREQESRWIAAVALYRTGTRTGKEVSTLPRKDASDLSKISINKVSEIVGLEENFALAKPPAKAA
ncbi:MAG: hypothetical protein ABIU54_09830 [Candidatus Eisenbacteria bacterium]